MKFLMISISCAVFALIASTDTAYADCAAEVEAEKKSVVSITGNNLRMNIENVLVRAAEAAQKGKKKKCQKLLDKAREMKERDTR